MKKNLTYLHLALGLATFSSLALAAETSPPASKEIHQGLRVLSVTDDERSPKEFATFLGVETSPVSRTLTEQLGLSPDMGLVVNLVVPDSPAAAVLKPHDILLKLDDQKLIEVRQLSVLVRARKDGDDVTLTYLRGGKEASAKVKLVKREVPVSRFSFPLPGPGNSQGARFEFRRMPAPSPEEIDRILPLMDMGREMKARVVHASPGDESAGVTVVNTDNSNLLFSDDAGTLEVKVTDGKKQVTAKDAKGAVVFSGPYNTDAERQAAPETVRKRLDRFEAMDHFQFKIDGDFHPGTGDAIVLEKRRVQFRFPDRMPVQQSAQQHSPIL